MALKTEDRCALLVNDFLISADTLRVYDGDRLLFTSNKDGLQPLLEYVDRIVPHQEEIKIFDKKMGNAAALLSVKADAKKVYSPLGSELAIKTLSDYNVAYHFTEIVPYIQNRERQGMCPLEKLSINKSPEEFYEVVRRLYH